MERNLSPDEIRRRLRLIEAVDYAARCGRRSPGISTVARQAGCDRKHLHAIAADPMVVIGPQLQRKLSAVLDPLDLSAVG